jgi:hypothetical protein
MCLRVRGGVKRCDLKRYSYFIAQRAHESFVPIALSATQVKIAMGGNARVSGSYQYIQQTHAIRSAAQCHQHRLVFLQ